MKQGMRSLASCLVLMLALAMTNAYAREAPGRAAPDGTPALAPLPDTVSWGVLQGVKSVQKSNGKYVPEFGAEITKLNASSIKVYGFMIPLEAGESHKRFMLSPYPPSCPFCASAGPDSIIEVQSAKPVKVTFDPIVVSGKFHVLAEDAQGLYYRITEASAYGAEP